VDTLKMWESTAQAILMSGKQAIVYYVSCPSGSNHILSIAMLQ